MKTHQLPRLPFWWRASTLATAVGTACALLPAPAQGAVPTIFTWATAVAGNWSDSLMWTNDQATVAAPLAPGQAGYVLSFTAAGTYTATNDRNAGFLLNRLNLGGSSVTLAGNALAFTANGTTLPQINQNSTSGVTISSPVSLAANLTVGGSGNGGLTLSGVLSGTSSLTKTSSGGLMLSGVNTNSGGIIVNAGSLGVGGGANTHFGTGPVTMNPGTFLDLNGNGNLTNAFTFSGATIANGNSFVAAINGTIKLAATSTFDLTSTGQMGLGGVISGPGGVTKKGTSGGALQITGVNSFTGPLTVLAGVVQVASINRVSGGSATSNLGAPLTVADGTLALGSSNTSGGLVYAGAGETTDRILKLAGATGGASLTLSGPTGGLLKFTSDVIIPGAAGQDNRKTITLTGAGTGAYGSIPGSGEISGSIGDSLLGTTGQLATSVTKAGTNKWTLAGSNTYSGTTKVQAGTLVCTRADSLGTGALDITSGAKVELNYIGTRQISALTFNVGASLAGGSYGSSTSVATNKNDTYFSGPGTVTVGAIATPTTTTLARSSGSSPSNGGTAVTFTATVAGSAPTGAVMFHDGMTLIGTGILNGSYQSSFTTSFLAGGAHVITALYVGAVGNPPSSGALSHTVTETRPVTTTTLALTGGTNSSLYNSAVTFTATVVGSAPTGTVTFYSGTAVLGTATLTGSAQASLTTNGLAVGWRAVTASYVGDAANAPSATATTLFQTVDPPATSGKLKVFILAGQSNMVAYGSVENGRDPNNLYGPAIAGGLGSLRNMLNENPKKYGYLADPANPTAGGNPGWLTRSDVWVTYWGESNGENRRGILDANFGAGGGQGYTGPEYGFGLVTGSQLSEQVLIIKYAFGGKSLIADFRPPSSGGTVGPYYTGMVARTRQVLANLATYFPAYNGQGYEIAGFGWHQGWNDIGEATDVYETNLTNLIKDVRTEFGVPNMPVAIGNTGMANGAGGNVLVAQLNVGNPALHPEFAGTVTTVDTRPFDYGELMGVNNQGYHWYFNGESYFNIGESMGQAMMRMLPAATTPVGTGLQGEY